MEIFLSDLGGVVFLVAGGIAVPVYRIKYLNLRAGENPTDVEAVIETDELKSFHFYGEDVQALEAFLQRSRLTSEDALGTE